jgi:AcrR family transcriptional regulator
MRSDEGDRDQDGIEASPTDAYLRARRVARAVVSQGLLDLADARLGAEGPGALSMRRLANAAGCSTMVFYSAFGDKSGLLRALAEREAARWIDAAGTLADPDPAAWLEAVAAALRSEALARPHHRELLFDPAVGADALAALRAALLDALDRAAPGAAADGVAEAMWSGWVGALAAEDDARFATVQRGLVRLWAAYLTARPSSSS